MCGCSQGGGGGELPPPHPLLPVLEETRGPYSRVPSPYLGLITLNPTWNSLSSAPKKNPTTYLELNLKPHPKPYLELLVLSPQGVDSVSDDRERAEDGAPVGVMKKTNRP